MNTDKANVDVVCNRSARKYSGKVLVARVLWAAVFPFFRFSPRPLWGWRRMLLRVFGADVGRGAHVYPTARITMPWNIEIGNMAAIGDRAILYALGHITIGERATVSQYAHLCAGSHDISKPDRKLLKPPIRIGADAWIAADAFVGPGVSVGARAIVGARAVVVKNVAPDDVVVGNPARSIRRVEE
jgi:putative colanic acid biosynthesis acetyltransferase WcaF